MQKIKDNIDLKILVDKYGFKIKSEPFSKERLYIREFTTESDIHFTADLVIFEDSRYIDPEYQLSYSDKKLNDCMMQLARDGLTEEVELTEQQWTTFIHECWGD